MLRIFLLILIFHIGLYANSQTVSELKNKLETTSGIEKAKVLLQLSNKTMNINSKEAMEYAEEAKKLAIISNEMELIANSNLIIAQIALFNHNYNQAIESGISASDYFKPINKKNYAVCEIILGRAYRQKNIYEKSINRFKNAYQVYLEEKNVKNIAPITSEIANVYDLKNEIKEAIKWYELSRKDYLKVNNPKKIIQVTYNLAIIYNNFGNYKKAEELFLEALEVAQDKGLKNEEANIIEKLKTVKKNTTSKTSVKTAYDSEQEVIKETYIKDIEQQKALSLEEIEKLSSKNQLIELKIKAQQDDYEKKILAERIEKLKAEEKAIKEKEEKERAELELSNERLKTEKQAAENKQLTFGIGGLVIAFVLILIGFINKRKHNRILNIKNIEISNQKDKIEIQNNNINSSIDYAKRIQEAILPSKSLLANYFPDSFIYLNPKDNVSGDFFWVYEKKDTVFVAVADCTGHGVPGAFVSIIMNNLLDTTMRETEINEPEDILEYLAKQLTNLIEEKDYDLNLFKDGMDISIAKISNNQKLLSFSGAKNPIYIVRNGEIVQLKATKRSLEVILPEKTYQRFENQKIELQKNDRIFLFSDGFPDQVGGKDRTKFYYPPFRKLLIETSSLKINKQKEELMNIFNSWKGNHEQIDDVTILGIRIDS